MFDEEFEIVVLSTDYIYTSNGYKYNCVVVSGTFILLIWSEQTMINTSLKIKVLSVCLAKIKTTKQSSSSIK